MLHLRTNLLRQIYGQDSTVVFSDRPEQQEVNYLVAIGNHIVQPSSHKLVYYTYRILAHGTEPDLLPHYVLARYSKDVYTPT